MKEERERSAHPLLYIIITLLALNLVLTLWLATRDPQESDGQGEKVLKLPDTLSNTERERIFKEFQTQFNAENADGIYAMIDSYAKFEVTREHLAKIVGLLRKQVGQIKDGYYSHYQHNGRRDGRDWFDLIYQVEFLNTAFTRGLLTITFYSYGGQHGMTGFNLNFQ
ncbi:MAG: hypothetical protein ACE5JS_05175 [Nitrospinota bacterium]